MGLSGGGRIWSDAIGSVSVREFVGLFEIFDTRPEWHCRILGHGFTQHSGLYAFRAQPAATSDWAGACSSGYHDALFSDWHSRDFGDGCYIRNGDLGSGSVTQPISFDGSGGYFLAGDLACDVECKYRR